MFDLRRKFIVSVEGRLSINATAKQIKSGISEDKYLNDAVQSALDRLEYQHWSTGTIIGVSGFWNSFQITIKLLHYGKNKSTDR